MYTITFDRNKHISIIFRLGLSANIHLVLSTMCFFYQAHLNIVPVFVSLKTHTDRIKATLTSTNILTYSYCLVAICGYLTFRITINHGTLGRD
ncbi:unnamed protein product [Rotaria sp. Silwood2]|nr:unnamed protein product [Rotaria sp. Silwood2]